MNKDNFYVGEDVELKIYWHDEDGNRFSKFIKGKVIQLTNDLIIINNGFYNESFRYSELVESNEIQPENEPYDMGIENYSDDIVERCLNAINSGKRGYVFNKAQLEKVLKNIRDINFYIQSDNKMIYIKKKGE